MTWIKKTLQKIPRESRILDAGAGEQQYKKFCAHLRYTSQDFARYDGTGDKKGLQTGTRNHAGLDIISDITSIPRPDRYFGAILCVEVLEHLPDPLSALKEFSRLLRKGGYLILTAPFNSLTHYSPYHFYTGFNRYFYTTHLSKLGFHILEINANGNYFEYLAQELRRLPIISKSYVQTPFNILAKIGNRLLLNYLSKMSQKDRKSSELLCFGYHVFAKKL